MTGPRVERRNGYTVITHGQAGAWTHVHRCAAGHEFDVLVTRKGDAALDARCPACGDGPGERLSEYEAFLVGEKQSDATRARHGTNALAGMRPDSVTLTFGYGRASTRTSGVGRDRNKEFIRDQRAKHAPRYWVDD